MPRQSKQVVPNKGAIKTDVRPTVKVDESDMVTIVPRINIALDNPDVQNFVILHNPKHDKFETTRGIEIPRETAKRLVEQGKAYWTMEQYQKGEQYAAAYRDPDFRKMIKEMES